MKSGKGKGNGQGERDRAGARGGSQFGATEIWQREFLGVWLADQGTPGPTLAAALN